MRSSLKREDLPSRTRMVSVSWTAIVFVITEIGRPFARTIAAVFDSYLSNGKGRHSIAV